MLKRSFPLFFSTAAVAGVLAAQTPAPAGKATPGQAPIPQQQPQVQVPSGPPDPAKAPIIEQLFAITKPEKMIGQMSAQYKAAFSNAAQQGYISEVRKFDDPSKYRADFEKLQQQLFGLMDSRLQWSKVKPQMEKAYSDTFTKDELQGLLTFYKSPAGQAEMNKMPKVYAASNAIGQSQMQSALPEMEKIMSDHIAALKASHPAPPPAAAKTPTKP